MVTVTPSRDGFAVQMRVEDDGIRRALARLVEAAADLSPVMDDIGAGLVLSTRQRFDAERDPTGRPWKPLSAETILRRLGGRKAYTRKGALRKPAARKLSAMKILFDSGHLKGGITHRATADQVEVGTDRVYGRIHQFGGMAGRGRKVTIPARPFLGLGDEDRTMVVDLLRGHLNAATGGGV